MPNGLVFSGQKNMTCADLAIWVNDELGLEGQDAYKEGKVDVCKIIFCKFVIFKGCMRKWLLVCNFRVMETKKGLYYDGHERDDVVKVFHLLV